MIVVRQAESLPPSFLAHLVSLLATMPLSVPVSLLISVSTNASFLVSALSLEHLRHLDADVFKFESPDELCFGVLKNLLDLNIAEDNKEQIFLSGSLLREVQRQFQVQISPGRLSKFKYPV